MMFQGPKGFIAQICEVRKQYNKMAIFHFFLENSTLIYILFSLVISNDLPFIECWVVCPIYNVTL